jgi:hypothetical protein
MSNPKPAHVPAESLAAVPNAGAGLCGVKTGRISVSTESLAALPNAGAGLCSVKTLVKHVN